MHFFVMLSDNEVWLMPWKRSWFGIFYISGDSFGAYMISFRYDGVAKANEKIEWGKRIATLMLFLLLFYGQVMHIKPSRFSCLVQT